MKLTPRLLALPALAFVGVLSVESPARANGKAVSLKPEYPVGSRLVYQTDMVQKQNIVMPQMTTQMDLISGQRMALDVLAATPDGGRKIAMEFLSFKMSITGMMPMSFDSSTDPSQDAGNPLASLRNMVGSKLTFTLKPDGSIAAFEGAEALAAKLGNGKVGTQGLDQIISQITNESTLKQMGPFLQTPLKAVAPGHSWPVEEKFKLGEMGSIAVKLKYVFTGVEARDGLEHAVVDSTGTLSMVMDISKAGAPAGMQMKVKDGKISGKNLIDLKAALLREMSTRTTMKMEMAMGDPAAGGMNMTIDMDQNQVTKLLKVEKIK